MSCCQGGSVDFFRVVGVVGGHGGAGRFPGRHELKVRRVRPVWSGSYARAGYLKTLVRRRARILGAGAAQPGGWVAHSPVAGPWVATWRPSWLLVRAPAAVRVRVWVDVGLLSVQGRGLPAERGELARAGDRDGAGVLAALAGEVLPSAA